MKSLMLMLAFLIPGLAQADVIRCSFSRPVVHTTYDMIRNTLTIEGHGISKQVIPNVSMQILGPGQFILWDGYRNRLQKLDLNFAGSDGASDLIYSYSVYWYARGGTGGCRSNFLGTRVDRY